MSSRPAPAPERTHRPTPSDRRAELEREIDAWERTLPAQRARLEDRAAAIQLGILVLPVLR